MKTMKKWKSNPWVKGMAFVLTTISLWVLIGSLLAAAVLNKFGAYEKTEGDLLEQLYANVCNNYSVKAVMNHERNFNMDEFLDSNFCYGVIQTNDFDSVDLHDKDSYLVENFDRELSELDLGSLYVHSYSVDADTYFEYSDSLLPNSYVDNADMTKSVVSEYPVTGYYYAVDESMVYALSGKKLYPLESYYLTIYTEDQAKGFSDEFDGDAVIIRSVDKEGNLQDRWYDLSGSMLLFDAIEIPLAQMQIVHTVELSEIGTIAPGEYEDFHTGLLKWREYQPREFTNYYVLSYVRNPMKANDLLQEASWLVGIISSIRYLIFVVMGVAFVFGLAGFLFLMRSAGCKKGQEELVLSPIARIPLDLYGVVEFFLCGSALSATAVAMWHLPARSPYYLIQGGLLWGIAIPLGLGFCMSLSVHARLGSWWKHTLCCRLFGWAKKLGKKLTETLPLIWQVWMVLGLDLVLEFLFVLTFGAYDRDTFYFLWFLKKLIFCPLVIYFAMKFHRLQEGTKRMAGGELSYKLQIQEFPGPLQAHAEAINEIGDGLLHAVKERMKSERFQTELITNVSHDIKTPLTSVINYVDLLQKEQIENPKAKEYLEVLSRQSARLKKLIEDLIEASKASSGSLGVELERCDAGVSLVQTIGEFEEKLLVQNIELQIKKPKEPVYIEADSRHLWRIFDNLMNNICKYAQPQTRAYVNLETTEETVQITFRNISRYPLNISSEELMERFVRGDSSRHTEGNGLGISIAKSLTELMNGSFELVVDGDLFKVILTFPLKEGLASGNQDERQ